MPHSALRRPVAIACIASLLAGSAHATVSVDTERMAGAVREHVGTERIVHYTTGINPQDYPCARASILALYEKRGELGDMSRYNPRRIFAWALDISAYYLYRFIDWLKGVMNPDAFMRGIDRIRGMARGGNPLAGMDRKVEGWAQDLSPKSRFVLQRKVHGLIEKTTNADGSCKQ